MFRILWNEYPYFFIFCFSLHKYFLKTYHRMHHDIKTLLKTDFLFQTVGCFYLTDYWRIKAELAVTWSCFMLKSNRLKFKRKKKPLMRLGSSADVSFCVEMKGIERGECRSNHVCLTCLFFVDRFSFFPLLSPGVVWSGLRRRQLLLTNTMGATWGLSVCVCSDACMCVCWRFQ